MKFDALKRGFCLLAALACLLAVAACGVKQPAPLPTESTASSDAQSEADASSLAAAAAYMLRTVPEPSCGSVGGEWAVLGLARGGCGDAAWFETYSDNLVAYVQAQDGVLHARKYTEYARVVLALTAIGKDPRDVGGYDLLAPLGDFERVTFQGLNGAVFALLALDAGGYAVPTAPVGQTQATREGYLAEILTYTVPGGGFALDEDAADADVDITAMTLCALAPYCNDAAVRNAARDALLWLAAAQGADGDYGSAESNAQVLIALAAYGIAPTDARFVKNGSSALDALRMYAVPDGGYCHATGDAEANPMASEQALLALVAVTRQSAGESGLYAMTADAAIPHLQLDADGGVNEEK